MTDTNGEAAAIDEPEEQESGHPTTVDPSSQSPESQTATEDEPVNPDLLSEVRDLKLQVERVSSWMDGSMSMLRFMGIGLAILAAFGVFQLVNSAIDSSVRNRVGEEVSSQVGDLTARLDSIQSALTQANEAAAIAENSANRAELAAQSTGARPNTAYYFGSTGFAEAFGVVTGEGNWVIVLASSDTLEAARARLDEYSSAEYDPAIVHVRIEYLVTIGDFASYLEAAEALIPIRTDINSLAYILNLREFCIDPTPTEEGYFECTVGLPVP